MATDIRCEIIGSRLYCDALSDLIRKLVDPLPFPSLAGRGRCDDRPTVQVNVVVAIDEVDPTLLLQRWRPSSYTLIGLQAVPYHQKVLDSGQNGYQYVDVFSVQDG